MNQTNISEESVENQDVKEEAKTMNSFEFMTSYNKDVFFADDNLDKEFKITDFLVEGYNYNRNQNTCLLYCTPYNKETNTSACYTQVGEKAVKTLNGKSIKQFYFEKGYDIVVYLNNPKDIKKLKIFNPSEEFVSTTIRIYPEISKIQDLKDIKCTFKGLNENGNGLVFVGGEILD